MTTEITPADAGIAAARLDAYEQATAPGTRILDYFAPSINWRKVWIVLEELQPRAAADRWWTWEQLDHAGTFAWKNTPLPDAFEIGEDRIVCNAVLVLAFGPHAPQFVPAPENEYGDEMWALVYTAPEGASDAD